MTATVKSLHGSGLMTFGITFLKILQEVELLHTPHQGFSIHHNCRKERIKAFVLKKVIRNF